MIDEPNVCMLLTFYLTFTIAFPRVSPVSRNLKRAICLSLLPKSFARRLSVPSALKLQPYEYSVEYLLKPGISHILGNSDFMATSRKGKASGVSTSSFFDLRAEIAKHEEEFVKNKAAGQTTLVGGVKRPDKVCDKVILNATLSKVMGCA